MKNFSLKALAVACLLVSQAEAKHYRVYVLTGQSNSLGCTTNRNPDKKAHLIPADKADQKVAFFWSNRSTRGGDGPSTLIGSSGGKIVTLKAQQGEGGNKTFWGPEIGFGRVMNKAGEKDILIIKASRGGGGNGFWLKNGQMYNHVVKTVKDCATVLEGQNDTFEIVGLLYMQGESNNAGEVKVAGQRYRDFLDQLREELPHAKKMQGYISGVASGRLWKQTCDQHEALAKKDDDISFFSNVDLQKHLFDRLHFDTKAKLKIGNRFAKAVLKREKKAFPNKGKKKSYKARTWTNAAGKKVTATFVSQKDGKVTLRLRGGKTAIVESSSLSQEDQAWLSKQ